jgi:hypothetical protein
LILVIDMVDSARWNDRAQLHARAALGDMARIAFRAARITPHKLVVEDRGDGMIVLLPATVSKVNLLDTVIPVLSAALREHNAMADPVPRIRLRMAIHAGEVLHGRFGWVGADLNLTCRLVNSQPLYQELTRRPHTDLVLVVSDVIHHGVIRHGYHGIDPATYTPIHVAVKETNVQAWMHTPGLKTIITAAQKGPNVTTMPRAVHGLSNNAVLLPDVRTPGPFR